MEQLKAERTLNIREKNGSESEQSGALGLGPPGQALSRPPCIWGAAGVAGRPAPGCFPGHRDTAIPQARQVHRINKADTLSQGCVLSRGCAAELAARPEPSITGP